MQKQPNKKEGNKSMQTGLFRLTIATLNLWKQHRWPERKAALAGFARAFRPDILCVQEAREKLVSSVLDALPSHSCITDSFQGWRSEGNVLWNTEIFQRVAFGVEDVGLYAKYRRLFWVRLRVGETNTTVIAFTVHLTYQEREEELESGWSPRIPETVRTIERMNSLVRPAEPAFLAGDLNDTVGPLVLLKRAGYTNCFSALGIPTPTTFPTYPTAQGGSSGYVRYLDQARDWIVANSNARVLVAATPHFYVGDIAPSDHWPIVAVYEVKI